MVDLYPLLKSKRDKHRVEIRRSSTYFLINSKRIMHPPSPITPSPSIFCPPYSSEEVIKRIDEAISKNDEKLFLTIFEQTPKTNRHLIRKLFEVLGWKDSSRTVVREICFIFANFTAGNEEEVGEVVEEGGIERWEEVLVGKGREPIIFENIVHSLSNIAYTKEEFAFKIVNSTLLRVVNEIFQEEEFYKEKKICKIMSFFVLNLLEGLSEPEKLTADQVKCIFQMIKKLLETIDSSELFSTDEKTREYLMFCAYSLSRIIEKINPGLIFDLVFEDSFIILTILDLIDKADKTFQDFLIPLLDFFQELVQVPAVGIRHYIECGLFETLKSFIVLKEEKNLAKKAIKIIKNFAYEDEIGAINITFDTFRAEFNRIFDDSIPEVRSELVDLFNIFFSLLETDENEIYEAINSEKNIKSVLNLLESEESKILKNTLNFIQNFLYYGVQEMARLNSSVNPIISIIMKGGYDQIIENLQNYPNKEIAELANEIIERFLD